ncbi:MAG: AsmA-like C-terminal region-containing protein [Opitutaceae bacterium]|jgi:hypothetical protein|nr:AsmA-like C-terminal region-containing protein [Opitutaceae bacterium]
MSRSRIPWPAVRPRRSLRGHCWSCVTGLARWIVWLGLAALLALQVALLVGRRMPLPEMACAWIRKAAAAQGLAVDFRTATLDPGGVLVLQDASVADGNMPDDPVITARAFLVRIDPGWLITRRSDLRLTGTGVNLLLPAVVSPSGRAEPLIENAHFSIRLSGRHVDIHGLVANIGGIPVTARGTLALPEAPATPSADITGKTLRRFVREVVPLARQLVTISEKIRQIGDPVVSIRLEQRRLTLTAVAPALHYREPVPHVPALAAGIAADNIVATITLPLDEPRFEATLSMEALALADLGSGKGMTVRVTGPSGLVSGEPFLFNALRFEASADRISAHGIEVNPARLALRPLPEGRLRAALAARWLDALWTASCEGRVDTLAGQAEGEGTLTPEVLAAAGKLAGPPCDGILQLEEPARISVRATLAPGGLPRSVEGELFARRVTAHHVPLDLASGEFVWDREARSLRFHHITLRGGDSIARGTYEMDTQTLDFRFLVSGTLRPLLISGWFDDWWPRFWDDFRFGPAPAAADVDVGGNWLDPHSVALFVSANGREVNVRGVDVDRLHTRLFIRPQWFDILDFYGDRAGRIASGNFSLRLPAMGEPWERMEFDMHSTLPLASVGKLIGGDMVEQLAAYDFTTPPRLHAAGASAGPGAARPDEHALMLTVDGEGPFRMRGFPLRDVSLSAAIRNDETRVDHLRVGVAGGVLEGTALISGPEEDARLAFDQTLRDADLALLVNTINTWIDTQPAAASGKATAASAGRKPAPAAAPASASAPAPVTATATTAASATATAGREKNGVATGEADPVNARLKGGRIDGSLKASGRLNDWAGFTGAGEASVRDAPLAQVGLLWLLSDLLNAAGLGFTSLTFSDAHGVFALEGRQAKFSELKIRGPSAEVSATGAVALENGQLDFRARLHPFERTGGLLGPVADLVFSPFSTALEFQLSGTLSDPTWSFRYGLRGLFRSLTGANRIDTAAAADEEKPEPPPENGDATDKNLRETAKER